jgi:hypothetical protein
MKMSSQEIAKRIKDRFDSVRELDAGFENGKFYARTKPITLLFEINNIEPKNANGILDWFNITREQMIGVIDILSEHQDINTITTWVTDFISEQQIDESKNMFLIPFAK